MHHSDAHIARFIVLVLGACLLGLAALQILEQPSGSTATAAPTPLPAPVDPLANATTVPGQLVANQAATTPPAAEQAPAVPAAAEAREPVRRAVQKRGGVACASPHQLITITSNTPIRSRPHGRAKSRGTLPARSVYLGEQTTAWVQRTTKDGRWGLITMPWSKPVGQTGWVRMNGARSSTRIMVVSDLSQRRMTVYRGCEPLFNVKTAIGRPGSPSPKGRFWVSDRVPVPAGQRGSFGSYAFGMSTVQPNLPAGWTGGDQMAIHGTGAPGSIGEAASAGCLRVSEQALERLRPLLRVGTPVIITA